MTRARLDGWREGAWGVGGEGGRGVLHGSHPQWPNFSKQVIPIPPHEASHALPGSLLTLQTQSHGPVSPAVLFKHLLKCTLFFPSFSSAVSTV